MNIPMDSLRELERERGISFETVVDAIGDRDDVVVVAQSMGGLTAPLARYTEEEFDRVIDTTRKGTFRLVRSAARRMSESGGGSIIAWNPRGGNTNPFSGTADVASPGDWIASALRPFGEHVGVDRQLRMRGREPLRALGLAYQLRWRETGDPTFLPLSELLIRLAPDQPQTAFVTTGTPRWPTRSVA